MAGRVGLAAAPARLGEGEIHADREEGDVVRATLRDLLPSVAESLNPPDRDADAGALGADAGEIREFALGGLERRLGIIGVPLSTL